MKNYNRGCYLIVFRLDKNVKVEVGKLGVINFSKGFYVYIGSAMNSLCDRVKRHLLKEKGKNWHIDYLAGFFIPVFALLIPVDRKIECELRNYFKGTPIKGFGCSDCNCDSHLIYYKSFRDVVSDIKNLLSKIYIFKL